ncbi:MAG: peptidylprolyl isomerase [Bacteroidales bacterium]|nr:peptidylprolyl isomerase [Bacteroidales bacterium]
MKKFFYIAAALLAIAGCKTRTNKADNEAAEEAAVEPTDTVAAIKASKALPEEPVFDIVTNMGTIRVKLYKDTPKHRDNFEKLALSGYYDNVLFHRVINGFMIQGGDPFTKDTANVARYGEGGPAYTIPAEMRDADGNPLHRHKKGALAAARVGDLANPFKASSGSQFYLVQNPDNCIHLDGEYTVFGETVAGLNVIDKIAAVKTDRLDRPVNDVRIIKIRPNKELNETALKVASGTELAVEKTE